MEESPWFARGDGSHDPRPGWFAAGGVLDGAPPSARVLGALEALAAVPEAAVPRFAGATHGEAAGMLAAVQALEGHVAGLKLAAVREIVRFHAPAMPGGRLPDPAAWDIGVLHEIAAIVLGQAERPGEAPGYGSLDPDLARRLAGAAAQSARSEFCVTFTDEDGHAAAHGCARLIRGTCETRDGPPGTEWTFARDTARPGPGGGYGVWVLTLPTGRRYRVAMHEIPLHDCDHRYATSAYRPGALLRHLVQVRDGECTFTGCSRPARESDFEHAVPYHQGGATDACNAGMRSRGCHKVKQSPGWNVTQPEPGWHVWTTPSGRRYTKGPKDYPA